MRLSSKIVFFSAFAGLGLGIATSAHAAGALAIGKCDRHGWTYGQPTVAAAIQLAVAQCASKGDTSCHVVSTVVGNCAALAVSGTCGPRGWATARNRPAAMGVAINSCASFGGTNCTVRRWVCDGG